MTFFDFSVEYKKIIEPIENDFEKLDCFLEEMVFCPSKNENQIVPIIKEFLSRKGKRIRSALIFLFIRALGKDVDDFCLKLALATELIHNATLIHDDIIDCSLIRRGRNTLNFDYDSKLAVLAGDYLLAEVQSMLCEIDDSRIREVYSQSVSNILKGELDQYFNRFKLLSIEKYIEKSKNKTARLFESGLVSAYLYKNDDTSFSQSVKDFALNFGIGFQIDNDLRNFENEEKFSEDFSNGDYSAPIILYGKEKNITDVKNVKKLLKDIKKTDAIGKTTDLKKHYFGSAIENISFLGDNQYKQAIVNLCKLFQENSGH